MLTYGDGVADVDITALVEFHRAHGKQATVTAVQPLGRFGAMDIERRTSRRVASRRSRTGDGDWINGGFFVLEPAVFDRIEGDDTIWEREPLEALAASGELAAYKHHGFWQPMDTLRDKQLLERPVGRPARRRGRCGDGELGSAAFRRRLRGRARPRDRAHRLQGLVARAAGCSSSAPRSPATRSSPTPTPSLFEDLGLAEQRRAPHRRRP